MATPVAKAGAPVSPNAKYGGYHPVRVYNPGNLTPGTPAGQPSAPQERNPLAGGQILRESDLPYPWRSKVSSKGQEYYYNSETRETTWKKPKSDGEQQPSSRRDEAVAALNSKDETSKDKMFRDGTEISPTASAAPTHEAALVSAQKTGGDFRKPLTPRSGNIADASSQPERDHDGWEKIPSWLMQPEKEQSQAAPAGEAKSKTTADFFEPGDSASSPEPKAGPQSEQEQTGFAAMPVAGQSSSSAKDPSLLAWLTCCSQAPSAGTEAPKPRQHLYHRVSADEVDVDCLHANRMIPTGIGSVLKKGSGQCRAYTNAACEEMGASH